MPPRDPSDVGADAQAVLFGQRLRDIRTARGESLATVGEATGISASFLSLVENGRTNITLGRMMRLVEHYGVHFNDLIRADPCSDHPDAQVVRRGDEAVLESDAEGIEIRVLAPDSGRAVTPILVTVQPGGSTDEATSYEGHEFVHILEGRIDLTVGAETYELSPGDTLLFNSRLPHSVLNPGKKVARYLGAGDLPHF